ncbi:hypothetical protein [Comamonas sp. JC664]|uniref:hypothetical protein n=1 Tax=Comamonas sp. JC664 TaxID=2801917 RepID=UPI00174A8F63|nr:hypothetical protein [Comamonas sp. JC664]MBL0697099.1 hypothetical protein [Comamonas sp. JC664]GHG82499.1 hypothetical protein GCM10012319_36650 [Comamonas sp. KCTC 72670]
MGTRTGFNVRPVQALRASSTPTAQDAVNGVPSRPGVIAPGATHVLATGDKGVMFTYLYAD